MNPESTSELESLAYYTDRVDDLVRRLAALRTTVELFLSGGVAITSLERAVAESKVERAA